MLVEKTLLDPAVLYKMSNTTVVDTVSGLSEEGAVLAVAVASDGVVLALDWRCLLVMLVAWGAFSGQGTVRGMVERLTRWFGRGRRIVAACYHFLISLQDRLEQLNRELDIIIARLSVANRRTEELSGRIRILNEGFESGSGQSGGSSPPVPAGRGRAALLRALADRRRSSTRGPSADVRNDRRDDDRVVPASSPAAVGVPVQVGDEEEPNWNERFHHLAEDIRASGARPVLGVHPAINAVARERESEG